MTDLLLNDNYTPALLNGDFATGESDEQHVLLICATNKGEWRESPLTGLDLVLYQNAPKTVQNLEQLNREASVQLDKDGYQLIAIDISSGEIDFEKR